jgi:hypothetical protein
MSQYLNWENQGEFEDPYEHMLLTYIFTNWSLTGLLTKGASMQDKAAKIIFKPGYPSGNRPFQVTAIKMATDPKKELGPGQTWLDQTTVKINLRAKRLPRPDAETNVNDPLRDLDKMEKEVERIARKMKANGIVGMMKLYYGGCHRVEQSDDNFTKSEWESDTAIIMEYSKQFGIPLP